MAKAFSSSQGISTDAKSGTDSTASQDVSRFNIQDRIVSEDSLETTDTEEGTDENDTIEDEGSANESEVTQEETQETSEGTQNVDDPKKELETWKTRYDNANRTIGRQGQELHQLRQMVTQLQQQFEAKNGPQDDTKFLDDFIKNPKQALAEELQRREHQKTTQTIEQQKAEQSNIDFIYQNAPDFDTLKNDILEVAKGDGIHGANLQMLEISMKTDPLYVLQFYKRAQLLRELRNTKQKGQSTLKKIASNSRKTQPIANVPNQSQTKTISDKELSSLSDSEFKALLKKYNM
jgi:hypothetical protein